MSVVPIFFALIVATAVFGVFTAVMIYSQRSTR